MNFSINRYLESVETRFETSDTGQVSSRARLGTNQSSQFRFAIVLMTFRVSIITPEASRAGLAERLEARGTPSATRSRRTATVEPRFPFRESLHGSRSPRTALRASVRPSVRPPPVAGRWRCYLRQLQTDSSAVGAFGREEMRGVTRTSDLDGFAESEPTLRAAA